MSETMKLVKEIKEGLSQRGSSQKDEVRVMQAMLNDKGYTVDVYGNTGKVGEYCPSEDARKMTASVLAATTKISRDEAEHLASEHNYTKAEAASMVNIGKEFINTYIETDRKLPLGGRKESNVALIGREIESHIARYPKRVVQPDGTVVHEDGRKEVPSHKTIKAGGRPAWVK